MDQSSFFGVECRYSKFLIQPYLTVTMKSIATIILFAAYAAAHSAVWTIEFDGTTYPARDARMDAQLGAKRVEWTYTNNIGTSGKPEPWQAVVNVLDAGITCELS